MDQVPVKISELYRAPRKVTVSSGVLQRKHVEDLTLSVSTSQFLVVGLIPTPRKFYLQQIRFILKKS